jgi:hypothetical protein
MAPQVDLDLKGGTVPHHATPAVRRERAAVVGVSTHASLVACRNQGKWNIIQILYRSYTVLYRMTIVAMATLRASFASSTASAYHREKYQKVGSANIA